MGGGGAKPLPLGLSGDPGGFPLYKQGDLVGGIGVEFDGIYTIDRNPTDNDDDPEERVALAASVGFEAPSERVGDNISIAGRTARYSDIGYSQLEAPTALEPLEPSGFVSQPGFASGGIRPGKSFVMAASAVADIARAETLDKAAAGVGSLSGGEAQAILDSAIKTADRTRSGIRTPRDTAARVNIFVVDARGSVLGSVRSGDAPVFGFDVALQKARTAALMSSPDAGALLGGYGANFASATGRALDGSIAITTRAVGNLARPFLPDGIDGTAPGPFSKPFPGAWSVFNTGLQLDLIFGAVAAPVVSPGSRPGGCAGGALGNRGRNGIQIFAGGVPLYRGSTLVGAIGVSGDGIDQDDMIAFYGASRRGLDYAGHSGVGDPVLGFNAPPEMRIDNLDLPQEQLRIRYVQCPEGPFIRDNEQNVCGDG
jgi:uncharacterized protein GlcG (DUF336 family)